ncbi:MAG: hypothetical protein GY847_06055 [Proteobacteria bacterium]|nr:hypothetical protein [Pseudomonadota bacterium]
MKMPRWIILLLALAAIFALAEFVMILNLGSDLEKAERKIERLSDKYAEIAFEGVPEPKTAPQPLASERLRDIELKLGVLEKNLKGLESGELGDVDLDHVIGNKVGEMMMSAVAMRGRMRSKTSLGVISKQLDLSEDQEQQFAEVARKSKTNILEMAQLANAEDLEFVAELNRVIKKRFRKPKNKIKKVREALSSWSRPGSNETYLEALTRMHKEDLEELGHVLTGDQLRQYKKMRISTFYVWSGP